MLKLERRLAKLDLDHIANDPVFGPLLYDWFTSPQLNKAGDVREQARAEAWVILWHICSIMDDWKFEEHRFRTGKG